MYFFIISGKIVDISRNIALLILASAAGAQAATFYVSPTGIDTSPGSLTLPFRTVQKAASVAVAGDTVMLRAGTYRETVTPPRNGSSGAPITFKNYTGEIATISGNDVLTGWTPMGNGVFRAAMPWNYNYQHVSDTAFPSNQVFLDGKMLTLSRWPKETNIDPVANPREGIMDAVSISGDGLTVTVTDSEFTDNPARWVGAKIWINLSRNGIDGQGKTGTVTAASNGGFTYTVNNSQTSGDVGWGIGNGTHYYLFHPTASALAATGGAAAALAPGEWFFDSGAGQMYVRTWDGLAPAEVEGNPGTVEARRRSWAFSLDNRSWFTLQGLRLFAASVNTDNSSANRTGNVAPANNILLDGLDAQYITHFTDLTANYQMQWLSKSGLILSGSAITLQNSTLRYSAGSGVSVLGQGNKILNNVLSDMNYSVSEAGALNTGKPYDTNSSNAYQISNDHEIAYNTIYRTPQQGINFRMLRNSANSPNDIRARIHHNVVHDAMMRSYDSAAIDSFGMDHQFLRIDHNVIFNVLEPTNFGIYFDFSSGGVVDHNLVFDVARPLNTNWQDTNASQNMRIFNNTALGDLPWLDGLTNAFANISPGSEIKNNLFSASVPTFSGSSNSNNAVSSPGLYTNVSLADYTLAAGATAAIDQGVSVSPFNDPLTGAPDLGAFERGQTPWAAGSSLIAQQPNPGNLIVTQSGPTSVQLSWTDRSPDETHFIIMRSSDGGLYWDEIGRVPANAQTFNDTQMPGGEYLYAVRGDRSPLSARATGRSNFAQALFYPGLYDAQSGGITTFGNNQIGGTSPGSWIRFNAIDFGAAGSVTTFTANYLSLTTTGQVQVWLDNPTTGTRVATLIAGTNDGVYRDVSGPVSATVAGVHDVYLKFTDWGTANMATFRFIGNAPANSPAEPSALTATSNGTAVQLAWTDNSSNENEFRVERSVAGGPFTFLQRPAANATSATDATVVSGLKYSYRICSVNIAAPSAFSSPAVATIPVAPLLAAPTALAATATSSSQINLTWADNSNNETGFKLERKTGSGGTYAQIATPAANATSYSDSGLSAATQYVYRVRANNAAGDSAFSAEANATTLLNLPVAPSVLAATATSPSQANLTWTDNANNETGFKLERKTGSGGTYSQIATPAANATSYSDTGLSAAAQSFYRVRANNAAGDSAFSNEANATTSSSNTGLTAVYFNNISLSGAVELTRPEVVDFDWGSGSPGPGVNPDNFSARWTGQVEAPSSGSYVFRTVSDDGVRLWVNGIQVINNWTNHASTANDSASISLNAGTRYDIVMEYYEGGGGAVARLQWQTPVVGSFVAIPASRLFNSLPVSTPAQSVSLPTDRARVTVASIPDFYGGPNLKVLRTDTNTPLRAGTATIWEKQGQEEPASYYVSMRSKGLNSVRMILFDTWEVEAYVPGPNFTPTDWNDPVYRTRQLARMERSVNYASANGMYVIINSHNKIPNYNESYVNALWTWVAPYFANRTHVLYGLANEPMSRIGANGDMDVGNALNSPRLQALRRGYDMARSGAPNTNLMILKPPGINESAYL